MREPTVMTDEELLVAAQGAVDGDTRPFEQLVERYRRRVMANCRYLTGSSTDAEDLAQDVFVKAYFGLRRFEARAGFGTWIQRIKINHCLNFLRSRRGKTFVEVDDPALDGAAELHVPPTAEAAVVTREDRQLIREVLDGLPDTLRLPLVMRDVDGLAYEEIADSLTLSLSAVKMRIKRGREAFRRDYAARVGPGAAAGLDQ